MMPAVLTRGGARIAADVDIWETMELARLMTLKTAVIGIEFGGGKTGIRLDMDAVYQLFDIKEKDFQFERLVKRAIFREYGLAFKSLLTSHEYIPAPDMGSGPEEMTEIYNATGDPASVTGKPEGILGWLPGRKESTGYGVATATEATLEHLDVNPVNAKVALQGFGNVGSYSAYFLAQKGIKIVGISDIYGGIYNRDGIDIEKLMEHTAKTGTVVGFSDQNVEEIDDEQFFSLEVDALVPAAAGHVLNDKTSKLVRTKAVISGANTPITSGGMDILEDKKVLVFPDIVANSAGVAASSMEYFRSLSACQICKEEVFEFVAETITGTFDKMLEVGKKENVNLTEAAIMLAVMRVKASMELRGWI
jgi:glutamate dehydrogenase/leucine dehydrogenase